ncbi:MAG: type IV pilin protein [Pseudomonadota bacterium]
MDNNYSRSRFEQGFTLIELMIVVAIVGILASLAIPAYTEYVRESRRTDGTSSVLDCATRLERNFTVNNTYTTADVCDATSIDGFYNLTLATTDVTFTVSASPTGPQSEDTECSSIDLNHLGVQSAVDDGGASTGDTCWKK